jgi:anti-anti-sigma factor
MASATTRCWHLGEISLGEPPSLCTVEVRTSEQATVVLVAGEVDLANVQDLAQALASEEPTMAPYLVVDVSALEFVDVMGLRVLLEAKRRAVVAGRGFVMVNSPPHIDRLLRLTQTSHLLDLVPPAEPAAALSLAAILG